MEHNNISSLNVTVWTFKY